MNEKRYPIQIAASRTGLTQHAIRAWERRYGAVQPERTASNRRLYSDDDITRLRLLARATSGGHSVGQLANLPTERLRELVAQENVSLGPPIDRGTASELLEDALAAIEQFNGERLETVLSRSELVLNHTVVIQELVTPLVQEIGDRWRCGVLRIGQEHLASGVLHGFLTRIRMATRSPESAPVAVFATPAGQWHELGALMAAAMASFDGWRVAYLGPHLPAEEVAAAARSLHARAVALSLVYPGDDPLLPHELRKLHRSLPEDMAILAGGRSSPLYAPFLDEIGANRLDDFASMRTVLEGLRHPREASRAQD